MAKGTSRAGFQTLDVYKLAERLAGEIWKIVIPWKPLANDTIGKQMVRSADSIGANIAQGVGRGIYADNRRFVRTATGSLYETQHWLRRAYSHQLLSDSEVERLKPLLEELPPRLNAYLRSIGQTPTDEPSPDSESMPTISLPMTNDQ